MKIAFVITIDTFYLFYLYNIYIINSANLIY